MTLTINGYFGDAEIDLDHFVDVSIPMRFNGSQPNAYGVEPATAQACESGDLVGDTRRRGSCNFEQITLIPHCNGTHTECVGHITNERIYIRDCLKDTFIPSVLISVEPQAANESHESYSIPLEADDQLITREAIERAIWSEPPASACGAALIVRTIQNNADKMTLQYGELIPPFFSSEAMQLIVASGFKHLLVDLPSIDRLFDRGKLLNHRIFWNVEQGSFETNKETRLDSTITELIYVPNEVEDAEYLLNLQIAPFESDASPSRPMLFKYR